MMERNVGGIDRKLRAVLGVILAVAGAAILSTDATDRNYGLLAILASAGLLFNAVFGRCLGNRLLGIDTCDR
ncbi:MAG: DUF2892 domain-containing protein [Natronomonas sp.]